MNIFFGLDEKIKKNHKDKRETCPQLESHNVNKLFVSILGKTLLKHGYACRVMSHSRGITVCGELKE